MTIETRSSIELKDIIAFEMECSKCHTRTIRKLQSQFEVPNQSAVIAAVDG